MLNRSIQPQMPARAYTTYQILAPKSTHYRPASCEEVDCPHFTGGWRTVVDEGTELGQKQAYYVRKESNRKYAEHRNDAGLTVFEFEAGQRCFKSSTHQVPIGRPGIFRVNHGDFRQTFDSRQHVRPEDWVEDFAEHQQKLADRIEKG